MKYVNFETQTVTDVEPGKLSYKPVFLVSGKWYDNGERYPTPESAYQSAQARFMVWTMPSDCACAGSNDEPNREG